MGINCNKGEILYCIPIRFWEEKEPIKCIVTQDIKINETNLNIQNESVLIFSEAYQHEVYINRKSLFFNKENAIKAIELYTQLHELYVQDETDKIIEIINQE